MAFVPDPLDIVVPGPPPDADAPLPSGDAYEAISRFLETEGAAAVDRLAEMLKGGGTKVVRFNCVGCQRRNDVPVSTERPEDTVAVLSALHRIDKERRELLSKTQRDQLAPAARVTLERVRSLSDEELATELATRRARSAADADPAL